MARPLYPARFFQDADRIERVITRSASGGMPDYGTAQKIAGGILEGKSLAEIAGGLSPRLSESTVCNYVAPGDRNEYQRQWNQRNPERRRAHQKDYLERHREDYLKYQKEYFRKRSPHGTCDITRLLEDDGGDFGDELPVLSYSELLERKKRRNVQGNLRQTIKTWQEMGLLRSVYCGGVERYAVDLTHFF
ncbi:MAG: hypothetical protein JW727_04285 [Candidatus Aenigmarchaeota archaeon]|nr:hypothetical protein [Candidatus Aenigmarchaeota archaeon]